MLGFSWNENCRVTLRTMKLLGSILAVLIGFSLIIEGAIVTYSQIHSDLLVAGVGGLSVAVGLTVLWAATGKRFGPHFTRNAELVTCGFCFPRMIGIESQHLVQNPE
jgi:hypothetical protein